MYYIFVGEDLKAINSDSVDLINCAQGAMWLNRPKFYQEARRVLRKNGVLCFYGYGIAKLDVKEASEMFFKVKNMQKFHLSSEHH